MNPRRTSALLIGGLATLALAAPTAVADPRPGYQPVPFGGSNAMSAEEAAGAYLVRELVKGGHHFSQEFDGVAYPDHGVTADAVLALDAAGVGQTEAAATTAWLQTNVRGYIGTAPNTYAGATAKLLNVAAAQQVSPTAFGGVDLVATLKSLEQANGRFSDAFDPNDQWGADYSNVIGQSLAIMGLKRVGQGPSANAVSILEAQQCTDGGFRLGFGGTTCTSDPDVTAFAAQALIAVRGSGDAKANKALDYLAGKQQADGGVGGGGPQTAPNANSTGLAGQAFLAGGRVAQARLANQFIARLQYTCTYLPDAVVGGIAYDKTALDAQVAAGRNAVTKDQDRRSTTQAILSLAGTPLYSVTKAGATANAPAPVCGPRSAGTFEPLTPARLLDTRSATKVAPQGVVNVQATGRGGVPAAGVEAVVVNLTAVLPTANGYASMWPQGQAPATVSNLNFTRGLSAVANLAVVKVGQSGGLTIQNGSAGSTHYLLDVVGYYKKGGESVGSRYTPVTPKRILDTRPIASLAGNAEYELPVRGGTTGVPAGATGVVMNVTAVNPSIQSYLTVYPSGKPRPTASNINWPGELQGIANLVYTPIGADGNVRIYNQRGVVDLVVDVVGWFGPTGEYVYHSADPKRVVDTRTGTGTPKAQLGEEQTLTVDLTGEANGIPDGAAGVIVNTTVANTTAPSWLTVWPGGQARPNASSINWSAGQTVPNLVATKVGAQGATSIYNSVGLTDVIMDLSGWYGG